MKFTLPEDRTVTTKSGHAITFTAGVPAFVPEVAHAELLALGAEPSDEPDDVVPSNVMPTDAAAPVYEAAPEGDQE